MKPFSLILCATVFLACLASAAENAENDKTVEDVFNKKKEAVDNVKKNKIWCGKIHGQAIFIKASEMTSVVRHEYTVDGVAFQEVTVDTTGNNAIRFYTCINEDVERNRSRMSNSLALLDKRTGGVTKRPAKAYPDATHSHNVEVLLPNKDDLNKVFNSLTHSLVDGQGRIVSIPQGGTN